MIRTAGMADLPALLALYAELHPDDPPLPLPRAEASFVQMERQEGRQVLIAEAEGEAAGTVDLAVLANLTRGGRPFMLVENVVVAARFRRRGVGRALLAEAVRIATDRDCYKIQLLSRAGRGEAHSFYEAMGFRPSAQGYRRYL